MFQSAHIVQTISYLDQHYADVIYHRQHHLAKVFRLLLFARGEIDSANLRYPLDNMRHLLAKFLADIDNVTNVSSTESCSNPATIAAGSIFISARIKATSRG